MSEQQKPVMENDSNYSGVFIDEATIVAARSLSNEDVFKNGRPVDVGIEFTLDVIKKDGSLLVFSNGEKPKLSITGNFKWDETNQKWLPSTTTGVRMALQRLQLKSFTKLNPDNSIPQEVLDECVGKKIVRLQYPHKKNEQGKNMYRNFNQFYLASVPDAKTKLRAEYDKSVAGGYTKPVIDDDVSFPGAPATAQAEEPQF